MRSFPKSLAEDWEDLIIGFRIIIYFSKYNHYNKNYMLEYTPCLADIPSLYSSAWVNLHLIHNLSNQNTLKVTFSEFHKGLFANVN